jgi:hypothetical protein
MERVDENSNWIRILPPRNCERYHEGLENMCSASTGALLIAKRNLPQYGVERGEIYQCARCYEPLCSRGCVRVDDEDEAIERFVKRAWFTKKDLLD